VLFRDGPGDLNPLTVSADKPAGESIGRVAFGLSRPKVLTHPGQWPGAESCA